MELSYDEFVGANANGWVVVYIGKEKTPKSPLFVIVTGPFDTQTEALRRAATLRGRYRRADRRGDPVASTMIKISVRPLWNTDTPA